MTQSRSASLIASFRVRDPCVDRHDLGAEQPHPGDVERLPVGVDLAHVDHALEAEQRAAVAVATPCWPAPVSAITRVLPIRLASRAWPSTLLILCDAGVVEVFALEQDPRAAGVLGQPLGVVQRGLGRPA